MVQTDSPADALGAIITFAVLGAAWNLGNVSIKKIAGGEKMQWWRLGQAVAVGAVAGGIVAVRSGEPDPGEFELAAAVAVPLVDKAINAARAGHRTFRASDDGDGQRRDEVAAALMAAIQQLQGDAPALPERPDRQEGGEPIDEEPRVTTAQETTTESEADRIESGP